MKRFLYLALLYLFPAWVSWIPAAVSVATQVFGGGGGGGGGSQGNQRLYIPSNLSGADQGWNAAQTTNQGQLGFAGGLANNVDPGLYAAYRGAQGINYAPSLSDASMAGAQYAGLANIANQFGGQQFNEANRGFGNQQALGNAGAQQYGQNQQLAAGLQGQGQQYYNALQGIGNQTAQAGQQVFNTAMDPQQGLYNQLFQQTTDQANAVNSMYGLGSSAAGAGLTSQAQNNFNLGWQNQQLGRQLQGEQAYQSALGQQGSLYASGLAGSQYGSQLAGALGTQGLGAYGQALQTGGQLGNEASAGLQQSLGFYGQQPQFTQQAGQVPLQAQQAMYQQQFQNAGNLASGLQGVLGPYQSLQNADLAYMGLGGQQQYNAVGAGLAQQQNQQGIYNQLGNSLGQVNWAGLNNAANNAGNYLNGWFSGGQGSDPNGYMGTMNNPSAYIPG